MPTALSGGSDRLGMVATEIDAIALQQLSRFCNAGLCAAAGWGVVTVMRFSNQRRILICSVARFPPVWNS